MNCPYCKKPMIRGTTYGGHRFHGGGRPKWISADSKLKFKMGKAGFWNSATTDAFVCLSCKKLVADLATQSEL